jgi:hypothetical protein
MKTLSCALVRGPSQDLAVRVRVMLFKPRCDRGDPEVGGISCLAIGQTVCGE